ncbi:DUF167 domain-containing protein [Chitiniphilus purpureus]|uniref:UPF0235 protein N8I74_15510 n=1 Tax=Chitiniphilus purpureus TaxID=2981137 RepID=A0ABY6DK54_9NEIS|nr:DUF167 domain-containing protein [Chitiniphilus sp. CD1]UXY14712.1 DUF167 domain-containing protein [Chitiniphilus sp. CD1]
MAEDWFRRVGEDWLLQLHIQPGAKRSGVAGRHGDALKLRLAAAPVQGKANEALLAFVATAFDVPLRQVSLRSGATSRRKVICVSGSAVAPDEAFSA